MLMSQLHENYASIMKYKYCSIIDKQFIDKVIRLFLDVVHFIQLRTTLLLNVYAKHIIHHDITIILLLYYKHLNFVLDLLSY